MEWQRIDVPILIHRIVGHRHVTLTDLLALDTTEVDLLLRVVLNDIGDRETIDGQKVGDITLPTARAARELL